MTTYRISTRHTVMAIIVSSDLVMQAGPDLAWAVGHDWPHVRDVMQKMGWVIEPVISEDKHYRTQWVDTEEASYELKWIGKTCLRITKHVEGYPAEDVTAGELPEEVMEVLG